MVTKAVGRARGTVFCLFVCLFLFCFCFLLGLNFQGLKKVYILVFGHFNTSEILIDGDRFKTAVFRCF